MGEMGMSDKGTYQDIMRRPRVDRDALETEIQENLIAGAYIDDAEIWDNGPAQKAAEHLLKVIIEEGANSLGALQAAISFEDKAEAEIRKLARQRADES